MFQIHKALRYAIHVLYVFEHLSLKKKIYCVFKIVKPKDLQPRSKQCINSPFYKNLVYKSTYIIIRSASYPAFSRVCYFSIFFFLITINIKWQIWYINIDWGVTVCALSELDFQRYFNDKIYVHSYKCWIEHCFKFDNYKHFCLQNNLFWKLTFIHQIFEKICWFVCWSTYLIKSCQ